MLLAGDVGGTKTLLGLFRPAADRPVYERSESYRTLGYGSLGEMIEEFLGEAGVKADRIAACAFGVAGPVIDEAARLTNVPWRIDAAEIAERLDVRRVRLVNDLVALGSAVAVLEPDELAVLQEGEAVASGNAALIAAGTGLGEALLLNVDGRFVPSPSEGGHADFAARTPREIDLLRELTRVHGRVECERVISGPGLVNLYRFTHAGRPCPAVDPEADAGDLPAHISTSALRERCERCVEALDLFVAAYGAEAGNLALRAVATAGVYLGGGIAPKILPALERGAFLDAFRSKDPMVDLLAAVPIKVILNDEAGLVGAAVVANERA